MASPNATFTDIVTTTLRNHPSMVADNVSAHNPLLQRLQRDGQLEIVDGGYSLVEPLEYAENGTYQRYSGYDVLNIDSSDVLSAAEYDPVQIAIHVTMSGREERQNRGSNSIINLAARRLQNAIHTAANNFSVDIYSSGALTNQVEGLAAKITTDGTGSAGGIDAGTYSFWANQFYECPTAPSASTMKTHMQTLWMDCVRGVDKPNLIVLTRDFYGFYWDGLTDYQRYGNTEQSTAGAGFSQSDLKFNTASVFFDSNANFSATGETGYFLNTKYLRLKAYEGANWTQLDKKESVDQDASVRPIIWMGNLCMSNRSLQGTLIDAA